MPSARHTADINAPCEAVMAVIVDFDAYTRFLPTIEDCDVVRADDNEWDVRFTIRVVKRLRYTLRIRQISPLQVRWSLLEGAFKVNEGGWDLESIDGGARTRAAYFIDLQVGMFVPSSIMRTLVDRSLPDTIACFKQEAERRTATN